MSYRVASALVRRLVPGLLYTPERWLWIEARYRLTELKFLLPNCHQSH